MKVDPNFTKKIAEWLNSEHTSNDAIIAGANLLVLVNNNRALHQNIVRNPKRMLAKLEYELNKHMRYRLDGLTLQDVRRMDEELSKPLDQAITVMLPAGDNEDDGDTSLPLQVDGGIVRKGIRPDHDNLPSVIQQLWAKNAERWKKIKETFETCKTLELSCDRYEYLKILKVTWYSYKADMAKYDSYMLVAGGEGQEGDNPVVLDAEAKKMVTLARAYISTNLNKLTTLIEKNKEAGLDDKAADKLEEWRTKIQQRVDVLTSNHQVIDDDLKAQLTACDIRIELTTDNENAG